MTGSQSRKGAIAAPERHYLYKFKLKLKKVGKTARPLRYDLNQIPNDYTVEVRNRFKGLDLRDRVPDELCPTTSSSVVPFSSYFQYFPASGSFPMSLFFASGGQSIGVSTSASVLPMNIQD